MAIMFKDPHFHFLLLISMYEYKGKNSLWKPMATFQIDWRRGRV